jgi:peroxiredoxin
VGRVLIPFLIIISICVITLTSCAAPVSQTPANGKQASTQVNDNKTAAIGPGATSSTGTGKLEITDVAVTNIQDKSLAVTWKTNLPSTSGLSALALKGGNSVGSWPDSKLVSEHKVILKDLEPSTAYLITIRSKDASGNQVAFETNGTTSATRTSMGLVTGDPAPDFVLKSVAGESIRLSGLRGKWIMIAFWLTRCDNCIKEIQYLKALQANFQTKDFLLLTINVGEKDAYTTNIIASQKLTFPVLLDEDKMVSESYTIVHFPTNIIINPQGNISKIKESPFNSEIEIYDFVQTTIQPR